LPLDVIDTDRPHQTDTPHVVAEGRVQVESGVAAVALGGPVGGGSDDRAAHVWFLDDIYKVGAAPHVDLQILARHADYAVGPRRCEAPGPLSVRAKLNVVVGEGAVPAITLVPWVFIPVAPSEPFRGGPAVFWGWELPARLELEMNAGVFFGTSPAPLVAPLLASALTWTVFGEFRVYGEIYAVGSDVQPGTGLLWAFNPNMQVDAGSFIGVAGNVSRATPFVGFSIRW
jgi:hypothetical protein